MALCFPSVVTVVLGVLAIAGCSSEPAGTNGGTGGHSSGAAGEKSNSSGGIGTGGSAATTGGTLAATGGIASATGGNPAATGGNPAATGGSSAATGGTPAATGGALSTTGGVTGGGGGAGGGSGGSATGGGSSTGGGGSGGVTGGSAGVGGGGAGAATGGKGGGGGEAGAADSPAAALDKFRFECPCKAGAANHTSDMNCNVTPETDRQTIVKTMGGDASKTYNVTLRVRGLTEPNTYKSGTLQGERFYIGGSTSTSGYTSYMMTVADPPQHYFFNYSATTGHVHFKLDYQVTVKIRGGSKVTFDVDGDGSVPDGHQVSNFDDTVVPDVPPAPMAYDGQFVQLDVVSAVVAP